MATKNDHESGITNGMTGVITAITVNGDYTGNAARYGLTSTVNEYISGVENIADEPLFSMDDLANQLASMDTTKKPEQRDRGPASHSVTIQFGTEEKPHLQVFRTYAEVATLRTAYVMTCHKLQGGEAPLIIIICHQAHKRMLNREWLYTAITRASQRCVILYTRMGLSAAINKQTILGTTLKEKVESFNKLINGVGRFTELNLPNPERI